MKKPLLAALGVLLFLGGLWMGLNKYTPELDRTPDESERRVERLRRRVQVRVPESEAIVVTPLVVRGKAPGGWYFEADFPVELRTREGSRTETFASAQGPWMTDELVPFTSVVRFDDATGGTAELILHRANASGLPEHDASVSIPVQVAGAEVPRIYFPNSIIDPNAQDCRSVHPVPRPSLASRGKSVEQQARQRIRNLLEGPTDQERVAGYFTSLPASADLLGTVFQKGQLRVDFNRELSEGVAGSCRVLSIRSQLETTLGRLEGVNRVQISVEGRVREVLQP